MKRFISPCSLFFGVLTLSASLFVGYYLVPYKVWEKIMEQSKIVKGSTRFKNWEIVPIPLFQKIYFFNVTNPKEVVKGGKPVLQEVGPYVYQQKRRKFDIVFNEQNDTIFYRESTHYFFRPELSNGLESDYLTFINIPYVGTAQKAAALDSFTRYILTESLAKFPELQLYVNVTVGEFLFKGFYLPFMQDLSELQGKELLPNNTFGIYYGKNGTDAGRFEIYSGVNHPEKFGNVVSWNGESELDWWDDEYCNRINGSNGALFQPYATKEKTFNMFVPGLCKSLRFTFESDEIVKDIPVLKYSIKPSFFESAKTNPDNRCYCSNPGNDFENCPENGVFQMAGCGKGVMALSQPHFYQGSQIYLNQSVGLNPDKELHEMAIYLESYTSVSAKVRLRFQMNVDLKPNKFFKALKKVPKMVHPMFWIDQSIEIPDDAAVTLREKLHGVINLTNVLTHVGIIVGSALIILSLLCFFLCSSNKEPNEKIECVSYHPQGTLPNGKISFNAIVNGKLPNNQNKYNIDTRKEVSTVEVSPLLIQNGALLNLNSERQGNQDESAPNLPEKTSNGDNQNCNQQQQLLSQSMQVLKKPSPDINSRPDSRLSPFPSVIDYSSSLSIAADNTLKELVDATSSYENL